MDVRELVHRTKAIATYGKLEWLCLYAHNAGIDHWAEMLGQTVATVQ